MTTLNDAGQPAISELAQQRRHVSHYALGTDIDLTLFGSDTNDYLTQANQLIDQYEDRLTVNRLHSEVMAINHAAGQHPVQVSAATYSLVKQAILLSQQHFGFNALIGPLVKLWRIGFDDAQLPTQAEIDARLKLVDPFSVELDDQLFSVYLTQAGMELDLGGIAKGYIADRIQDYWEAFGQRAGMINLGGNLLMVGDSPLHDDHQWRVGIQNPLSPRGNAIASVKIGACSAVTSGIYERHFEINGQSYHHILDSKTGYPRQNDLLSVTIFSKKSIDGEIETTRLFFAGQPEDNWGIDRDDLYGAIFVTKEKKLEIVGLADATVTLLDPEFEIA
ncbi:FAD:protein FMN transferase [Lactiplantibacillus mudanjiangensis]|uniref:FAD:protein FMN transferase n=1 Tax=Lactiplantibacillus mudanjiangensis TaxID=1296538 RepID=A0A660E680_9LACO|nr:FAD:protein FMN transferase [Lactiplantibacillus mudanjiangensis]VDG20155.1 thiamine biosynthesis protein ApbE [Lactobacillus sp.] [Lactiplantibacillus mudanjiangensis]VDG24152.1 thiamine biosynthesis protein ApbE [Lactobacillus sp.] [Lactiplantibacillus mudanjiangensis]VDG30329.1 thiamine biosynthesis protein ApbE [Lactobacillus sp.] [Lactiplantibacillus mudanjiangensis]VDG33550.1 thiamine biosynthesis protein ApbE [Lactobacillus sp.] [Lactiplantibacillus mudanjiangensis]